MFKAHIDRLEEMADSGDLLAAQSIACMALIAAGWRYGDPDPTSDQDETKGDKHVIR